jgi:hypothetical protein
MTIKISQLPLESVVSGVTLVPIVDPSGPTSYATTLADINTFINANLSAATTSLLGAVKPDGTTITVNNGIITVPTATSSTLGLVVPDDSTITISSGTISATLQQSTVIHAFAYDSNHNLIYTQTSGTTFNYTSDGENSPYVLVDIGTSVYSYSLDSNGNLIATFNS